MCNLNWEESLMSKAKDATKVHTVKCISMCFH